MMFALESQEFGDNSPVMVAIAIRASGQWQWANILL